MTIVGIIGGNICTPHVKRIKATDFIVRGYPYTAYGRLVPDDPAVDLEPGARRSFAGSWLVDGKRDEVFRIGPLEIKRLHLHPWGHAK